MKGLVIINIAMDKQITFFEYRMTQAHRAKLAHAHKNNDQSASTEDKISAAMVGNNNRDGTKHTKKAKDEIARERGHYDPIGKKKWIVNAYNKTFRSTHAPYGYKDHKRNYYSKGYMGKIRTSLVPKKLFATVGKNKSAYTGKYKSVAGQHVARTNESVMSFRSYLDL